MVLFDSLRPLHDLLLTDSPDSIILRNLNVFLCLTVIRTQCTTMQAKAIVGDDRLPWREIPQIPHMKLTIHRGQREIFDALG